jgi:hypothetical protein
VLAHAGARERVRALERAIADCARAWRRCEETSPGFAACGERAAASASACAAGARRREGESAKCAGTN